MKSNQLEVPDHAPVIDTRPAEVEEQGHGVPGYAQVIQALRPMPFVEVIQRLDLDDDASIDNEVRTVLADCAPLVEYVEGSRSLRPSADKRLSP